MQYTLRALHPITLSGFFSIVLKTNREFNECLVNSIMIMQKRIDQHSILEIL